MAATKHKSAEVAEIIGLAVRNKRREYMLTQAQLAGLVELSDKTVRDIEQGTGNPGLQSTLTVLKTLGLSLEIAQQ